VVYQPGRLAGGQARRTGAAGIFLGAGPERLWSPRTAPAAGFCARLHLPREREI